MPWVLFVVHLALGALILGPLSALLFVQLTLVPSALLTDVDFTTPFDWALTAGLELVGIVVLFAVTVTATLLIGLPVRLIPPMRRIWLANGEATVLGVILGVTGIAAAYLLGGWTQVSVGEAMHDVFEPSPLPLLIGWAVLSVSVMHLVWPARWLPRRARAWWTETYLAPNPRIRPKE